MNPWPETEPLPPEDRGRGTPAPKPERSVLEIATDGKTAKAIARENRAARHEERLRELAAHLTARGIVAPTREWKFAQPSAGWAFDLAWPEARVALEVDGGAFVPGGGRHGRGAGFREDLAKRNAALALGWRVVHVLPEDLGKSATAELVRLAHETAAGRPLSTPGLLPGFILDARRNAKKPKSKPPRVLR